MATLPPRALRCAAMVALALLSACRAAPPHSGTPSAKAPFTRTPSAKTPDTPGGPAPVDESVEVAPVIAPAARYGLEITWWTADDSAGTLAHALHALAVPDQSIDLATLDRLRLQGLRPVRIAESSLLSLTTAAPPTAGMERLWIGLAPDWTPTRFPAPFDPDARRVVEGLSVPTQVSMLRFLWRSYLAAEDLAPILRTDLTGQAISADYARERMSARSASAGGEARLPRPQDAGPLIDTLSATLVLHPHEVIVLIGENPAADWSAHPSVPDPEDPDAPPRLPPAPPTAHQEPAPSPDPADDGHPLDAEDRPVPSVPPPTPQPSFIPAPSSTAHEDLPPRNTFGELVLSPVLPTNPSRPGRLIIALIPQIPERLELIPKAASSR